MKRLAIRFLCVLSIVAAANLSIVALAQESDDGPPLEADYVISLEDLGYNGISIEGLFGSTQIYVSVPVGWVGTSPSQATLNINSSPLLAGISNLSVKINGQPVTAIALAGGTSQQLSFAIPSDAVKAPGFLMTFEGYLHLTDDDCEDAHIPGQWVTIGGDSLIGLNYTPDTSIPQLEDVFAYIYSTSPAGIHPPLLFVIPDEADPAVLSVATQVASGVAGRAPSVVPVDVSTARQVTDQQLAHSNVILIGLPNQIPLIDELPELLTYADGVFTVPDDEAVPGSDAIFEVTRSPWNAERVVLVVSANQPEGLYKAGEIFSDPASVNSFSGSYQFASERLPGDAADMAHPWSQTDTTLGDLGFESRVVWGIGVHSEYFTFNRPPGTIFDRGSRFILRGTASSSLDATDSSVGVFLNETPLGTYAIANLINDHELVFDIPVLIDQTNLAQQTTIRVEVSNQVANDNCGLIDQDNVWTHIESSSGFEVQNLNLPTPDLLAFPAPFVSNQPDASLVFVLPDDPDPVFAATAIRLAYTFGQFATSPNAMQVVTASDFEQVGYDNHFVFLLTGSDANDLDAFFTAPLAVTSDLEDTREFASGSLLDLALYNSLAEPFGVILVDNSPVVEGRGVMVITSDTAAGFEAVADALTRQAPPIVKVSGRVALVRQDREPYIVFGPGDIEDLLEAEAQEQPPMEPGAVVTQDAGNPAAPSGDQVNAAGGEVSPDTGVDRDAGGSAFLDSSIIVIVVPILVSLVLIGVIWSLQRGRRSEE